MSANRHISGVTNPLDRLKAGLRKAGTQRAYAAQLGISLAYLNDVLHGRRQVSERLAGKLGLVRETIYREQL